MTTTLPKAWIGIDPGKTGAMVLLDDHGFIGVHDWVDELTMYRQLELYRDIWDIQYVCIEKVWGVKGNSAKSNTTFQQHYGAWLCILKLLKLPYVEVTPQKWMKRRIRVKKSAKDKPSADYVAQKYPNVDISGPRGGIKDGRSDALCIAEYAMDMSNV